MHTQSRKLTIIAGPNGAGKTTFAQTIYPDLIVQGHFLNADVFAQEMSPEDIGKSGVSAGKKLIHLLNDRLNHNQSILLETTLSGKSLLEKIKQAREKNFITRLIFLWISDVELCDFRVKGRVASGGHNVPIEDIRRRYRRGLQNLPQYLAHIDEFEIFQANQEPRLLCHQNKNKPLTIKDNTWFSKFCDACDVSFKVADDEKVVSAAHITEEEGEEDDVDL